MAAGFEAQTRALEILQAARETVGPGDAMSDR